MDQTRSTPAKVRRFVECVGDVVRRKAIALEIEEHELAELNRLLEKFYAEVKEQKRPRL